MFGGLQNDKNRGIARGKKQKYPITKDGDSWLDEVLVDETKDGVWLITVSSSLLNCELPEKSTLKRLKTLKTLVNTGVHGISKHFLYRLHVS